MAKKGKKGGGRKFVRDAIGRFAFEGGQALGRVAKEAMKSAEDELSRVGRDVAKDAVSAAEQRYKRAKANWSEVKGEPGTDSYHEFKSEYQAAIRARAKAKAALAESDR